MRTHLQRCLALALVLAAAGRAQNPTVPAALHGIEGGGGTNIPFGSNLACRYQCIYDAGELPWTGPRVLTGISLRADCVPNVPIAAKGFLDVSLLVSTTARKAADASPVFAANRGADATWVLQNQPLMLPAQPALPAGPRPANIPLVFQVPWAYGLTPAVTGMPAPDSLLIELWIHYQPSGSYRMDNLSSCTAPTSLFGNLGPACAVPGQPPVELTGNLSMLAGSSYAWQIVNGPPAVPFLLVLNATDQGGLFGNPAWPLPYPMFDPQQPSLPSPALQALVWSAPDCWLNIDPVAMLGSLTDATGAGSVSGWLPPGPQLVGATFYAQALVFAPTANPLRLISSLGRSTTVCGPLAVARVHAFYDGSGVPPPAPPSSGMVVHGVGLIFDVL